MKKRIFAKEEKFDWRKEATNVLLENEMKKEAEESARKRIEEANKRKEMLRLLEVLKNYRGKRYADLGYKRRQVELVREIGRQFVSYKKREYRKEIRRTIRMLLNLFPAEVLAKANRRFKINSDKKDIVSQLVARLVIMPSINHLQLQRMFKAYTFIGKYFAGLAFVDEKTLKKGSVLEVVAHELCHLIEYSSGKSRKAIYDEILAKATDLFIISCAGEKERGIAIKRAKQKFSSKSGPAVYDNSVNRGQMVFLLADEIRMKHGIQSAEQFFRDLSAYKELTFRNINLAYSRAIRP
jgi:hypothetical protein